MKNLSIAIVTLCFVMAGVAATAAANTIGSSTMYFQGTLTEDGGVYTGVANMLKETTEGIGDGVDGYDVYAKEGDTAWFGDKSGESVVWTSQAIAGHDAWPTWTPDTPDWYQYSVEFYEDGGQTKWAVRNHAGSTESNPHSTAAMGVPMSGIIDWNAMVAEETEIGAYLPGTGTAEIPGGAASKGGGAGCWDMDWSWGSEMVPLQTPYFTVSVTSGGGGSYDVVMTPTPEPGTLVLLITAGLGVLVYAWRRRRS